MFQQGEVGNKRMKGNETVMQILKDIWVGFSQWVLWALLIFVGIVGLLIFFAYTVEEYRGKAVFWWAVAFVIVVSWVVGVLIRNGF